MAFTAPEDELLEEEGFSAPDDELLMEDTGQGRAESAFGEFGRSLAKVGTGTVEGLGQFGSSYIRNLNPIGIAGKLGVPGVQSLVDKYASIPEAIASGASSAQQKVEEAIPVNPLYQSTLESQAAGIGGQVAGQVGSILTGAAFTKAPKILQILGLGQAGLLGMESGYAEADRLGVTDPWKRDAMAATFAAAEAGVEGIGGYGGQGFIKSILGQTKEALGKGAGKRFLKTVASEGIEEPITGILQSGSSNVFAEEDPNNPGYTLNGEKLPSIDPTSAEFWEDRAKEAAGGAFGGGLFGVAGLIGSRPSVQDRQKALQRADLTLEIMRDKPDLTEEDRQDMEALQVERDELALDLGSDETVAQSSQVATDSLISSAQIARDMGMNEAADILESIVPPATQEDQLGNLAPAETPSSEPFIAPEDELEQPTLQANAIQEPIAAEVGTYPSGDQSLGGQESSQGVGLLNQGQETTQEEINAISTPVQELPQVSKPSLQAQTPQAPGLSTGSELAAPIKNSRPVELNVITKAGLAKETVEASPEVKRTLIDQKKLYTKLLNCLNS